MLFVLGADSGLADLGGVAVGELIRRQGRIVAIDSVRGLLVVLMILEHSRQIVSGVIVWELPRTNAAADLSAATAIIRFLSHLCAPGFFFLLGVSAALADWKKPSRVIRRGLLLMGLQVTAVNLGWGLPFVLKGEALGSAGPPVYLGVLFSLGCSAVAVGFVQRFSPPVIVSVALALSSTVFLDLELPSNGVMGLLVASYRGETVEIPYPLLPWTAVALLGTAFAKTFPEPYDGQGRAGRQTMLVSALLLTGAIGCMLFHLPSQSFHKYPPSLIFLVITVLTIVLILNLVRAFPPLNMSWLQVIGRHPLLIYVLHLYLIGAAAVVAHGDGLPQIMGVAATVTAFSVVIAWAYEASPLCDSHRNTFNTYHRIYDRFMQLFGLYRPEEVSRTLPGQSDGHLLDVAGGTGFVAAQLRTRFAHVVLIDLSGQMLAIARDRGLAVFRGSALSLPFASNSFAAVICTDALHHIKDADTAVREIRRVLQAGGRVVIQEFHIEEGLLGGMFSLFERLCVDRSQFIAPDELEALLARHGFVGRTKPISRIGYIYEGCLPPEEA